MKSARLDDFFREEARRSAISNVTQVVCSAKLALTNPDKLDILEIFAGNLGRFDGIIRRARSYLHALEQIVDLAAKDGG